MPLAVAKMTYRPRIMRIPEEESFFLFGPRGTGKTTFLRHTFPNALRLDLLDRELERKLLAKPERLIEYINALTQKVCIIDEIQKVPGLIPVIHSLIETKRDIQFILTGSSTRKLRRSLGDLLGGRALLRYMTPYLACELKDFFDLKKTLEYGLIPMVWESKEPHDKMSAYISAYLKEEVQQEGIIRNLGDFARFMEIASFSHGSLWVSTEIAREASVKRQTVDNYLQVLEDLLLGYTLPVFTRKAKRALVSRSKFYYFDVGVFRELRPKGPLDKEAELEGPALEGLVAQHLYAWTNAQKETHRLYFWRTKSQIEVDFIVYGPSGFWAIEVKRGDNVSKKDIKSLQIFQKEYPEAVCLLLYTSDLPQKIEGIHVLPIESFLKDLHPSKALLT